ncbi:MAG TPA: VOC family protein [Casimicrobiaceae bacterium]|nr:VOC family protein [Casimicrobiaceae bacterium]
MTPLAEIDHLVYAATTLAQGIDYFAELTGIVARPGGKHVDMGTHNALVRLGERLYLEIIAIDPSAPAPSRKRWFDLDDGDLRADILGRPQLVHWVARTKDLERAIARCGYETGPVHAFSRGDYRWRITVPDDGKRPGRGVLPTLIQWDSDHPADALPDSGAKLEQLAATHREPAPIRRSLEQLDLADDMRVSFDRVVRVAAMLRTPRGLIAL